jgi:hypothetical protein
VRASGVVGLALACVLLPLAWAVSAHAAQVTRLSAIHRDGQTFLTWNCPQIGTGWTYRVYSAPHPIAHESDFTDTTLVAVVRDSSWYDRRLSACRDTVCGYAIDSLAPPLDATHALWVVTPTTDQSVYYAVTSQLGTEPEDLAITPGGNSLTVPVEERVGLPRPLYQRTLQVGEGSSAVMAEVYTLWTSDRPTPLFPAMANRPGVAFDCAVVRGGAPPLNSLLVAPHHAGGSFLTAAKMRTWYPGEWVLALDDPLPNGQNTFWYGYHENYDVFVAVNPAPTAGVVHDYTLERVLYTVLWARRDLPVDTTRVYAMGASMGGIGSAMLAFRRPDLFAGVLSISGKYDFSFLDDPNPSCLFNTGGAIRVRVDRLWGPVPLNLPSSDGCRVFEALNSGWVAHASLRRGLTPLITYDGRRDEVVGWAEKIPFFAAMQTSRQGGYFFFDMRDHGGQGAWDAIFDPRYLYRFRTDLSYPALSNCTADSDPGDGHIASGDSVGTINGYVEWDTALVDEPDLWRVTLTLRDLSTRWDTLAAPDSVEVDVTLRRLQQFVVTPGASYRYTVTRVANGAVLQAGTVVADTAGLVTVGGVIVPREGSRLQIEPATGGERAPPTPTSSPRGPDVAIDRRRSGR